MQPAPAVSFDCDDGGAWRAAVAVLYGLSAAAMLRWALGWLGPPGLSAAGSAALAALAVVAGLGVAAVTWRRAAAAAGPGVRLAWDGQCWQLHDVAAAARPGRVVVALDLGAWMLLRFEPRPRGAARWLAVAGAAGPAARAALHAGAVLGDAGPATPGVG